MEDLPTVSDHPLSLRPLPVDHMVCPAKQDEPKFVPTDFMSLIAPRARVHAAVYEDTGRDWKPVGYTRSPWAVVRGGVRNLYQKSFFACHDNTVSFTDITNTSHAFNTIGSDPWNRSTSTYTLRWGSSNTAATAADRDVLTLADNFTASSAFNGTAYTATFSGSKIYAGANTTLREVCMTALFWNTAQTSSTFSMDRTVVGSPVAVNTNQTVSLQYDWAL